MRNADELIRLASATGTYDSYVGDGATIPWEEVIYPVNFLLFTYKQYLDANWPEAFKLHDWCYTPLGSLIQVTRDEADLALYEIIARDSIRDARIVYAAVRLAGGQYFGTSMTGFAGASKRNMRVTPKGGSGMATKIVMMFKDQVTGPTPAGNRIAGFSEGVWSSSDDVSEITSKLMDPQPTGYPGLLFARAACLPASASIIGYKLYRGGQGRGSTSRVALPGNASWPTDVPNLGLQMNCRSPTTGQVRRWILHAVPDQFVITGSYAPSGDYARAVDNYKGALQGFGFYSRPTTEIGFHVVTVVSIPPVAPATSPVGLVTTFEVHSFMVGDQVVIYSTKLAGDVKYTVTKRVTAVVSGTQFTVSDWTVGNTTGGIAGSPLKVLDGFTVSNITLGNITTRRVGRPFDLFHGRRSKRRRRP